MLFKSIYFLFALLSFINGAWMLIFPHSWYVDLPAAVPDTGPYNGHFIRDLGLVFLLISAGFVWCAMHPSTRILVALNVFFTGHALLHVLDLYSHRLPRSHWRIDFPGVFVPAVILIVVTFADLKYRKPDQKFHRAID